MNALSYLIEVNLLLALHLLLYATLLRHQTRLNLNRGVLLGGVLMAWLWPLWEPASWGHLLFHHLGSSVGADSWQLNPVTVGYRSLSGGLSAGTLLWGAYLLGVVVAAAFLFGELLRMFRLLRQVPHTSQDGYRLYLLPPGRREAFSFLNRVVVSEPVPAPILEHELVHVRQRHSWDVLLLEVCRVLCWFNPAVYWLSQLLRELHEYLADRDSSALLGAASYAELLVSVSLDRPLRTLMQAFHSPLSLKNRIHMLYKNTQGRSRLWRYLLGLPLMAASFLMVTAWFAATSQPRPGSTVARMLQTPSTASTQPGTDYPSFPGGQRALMSYLSTHIKYPLHARNDGHQGMVLVRFVVQPSGVLSDVQALPNPKLDPYLSVEAVRVVRLMPHWIPARKNDRPVAAVMTLPITFVLQ